MRRSLLFIPGNNAGMLMNANYLGADSVILDLEDAVSPSEKDSARVLVNHIISSLDFDRSEIIVRINAVDTEFWQEDLQAIVSAKPVVIMPPKVNREEDVMLISSCLDKLEAACGLDPMSIRLIPLIETAMGVENIFEIAVCNRVDGVLLGGEDLTADLCCQRTTEGTEIFYSRSRLVMAGRAAGIEVYDTPFTDINDDDGMKKDMLTATGLGFSGKASISPRHVSMINDAFSPTAEEISYAEEVMQAIAEAKRQGKGVIALRGKMIDAPIVWRAKRTLEMAAFIRGEHNE